MRRRAVRAGLAVVRSGGGRTNREGRVVVSMGMMERAPEDHRAVAEASVLALEAPGDRFDRFTRFELPRRLALWREVRVRDRRFLGVGTEAEAVGDEILCACGVSGGGAREGKDGPSVYLRRSQKPELISMRSG